MADQIIQSFFIFNTEFGILAYNKYKYCIITSEFINHLKNNYKNEFKISEIQNFKSAIIDLNIHQKQDVLNQ